jgi:Tol biopolymer transport system component
MKPLAIRAHHRSRTHQCVMLLLRIRLAAILLSLAGCYEPTPSGLPWTQTSVIDEVIPYEALGSGKLGFVRGGGFLIIDSDARNVFGIVEATAAKLSHDGKNVAYQVNWPSTNNPVIQVYNLETKKKLTLSNPQLSSDNPCWLSDSGNVLFGQISLNGARQLMRNSTGKNAPVPIVTHKWSDNIQSSISVAPNDKLTFCFSTADSANKFVSGIFTMNVDGTQLTQITFDSTRTKSLAPSFSPDGLSIAYMKATFGQESIWISKIDIVLIDTKGKNPKTVATLQLGDSGPYCILLRDASLAWCPDGSKLAFNMCTGDGVHIYTVNSDGTGITKITSRANVSDISLSWIK